MCCPVVRSVFGGSCGLHLQHASFNVIFGTQRTVTRVVLVWFTTLALAATQVHWCSLCWLCSNQTRQGCQCRTRSQKRSHTHFDGLLLALRLKQCLFTANYSSIADAMWGIQFEHVPRRLTADISRFCPLAGFTRCSQRLFRSG